MKTFEAVAFRSNAQNFIFRAQCLRPLLTESVTFSLICGNYFRPMSYLIRSDICLGLWSPWFSCFCWWRTFLLMCRLKVECADVWTEKLHNFCSREPINERFLQKRMKDIFVYLAKCPNYDNFFCSAAMH